MLGLYVSFRGGADSRSHPAGALCIQLPMFAMTVAIHNHL
jgi:hypothetical protein